MFLEYSLKEFNEDLKDINYRFKNSSEIFFNN